jgi:hypothetical protein
VLDRARIDEVVDRLVARNNGAQQDDEHDDDAGKVFYATQPVVEDLSRRSAGQDESNPERNCGRRIPDIVDRVG